MPDDTEWQWVPTKWWRVLTNTGAVWAETSDEEWARHQTVMGYRLQRMEQRTEHRWVDHA